MSQSECERQQCRKPRAIIITLKQGPGFVAQCLPVLMLSQMWRLVYLALIEDLEILPWHVSTGCCPGELTGEHRRGASAQGTIRRQSSCM